MFVGGMTNVLTRFKVKCFAKDREKSVEFLSDILLNSVMDAKMVAQCWQLVWLTMEQVEVERDVILLEMKARVTRQSMAML